MGTQHQKRIVLVESETALAAAFTSVMTHAGFRCDCVTSAEALDDALRQEQPDLILIDQLPDGPDPSAICQTLRCDPRNASVKIVLLNGSGRRIERRRCKALGADSVIAKPFGLNELRDEMRRLLSGAPLEAV